MDSVIKLIQELKNINVVKEEEYDDSLKPGVPLREIKLKASDGTNLHETKFGGKPDWIQNDETPRCPDCKAKMSLVAQIDSFDREGYTKPIAGNKYMFSDVGIFYVFFPFCYCGTDPKLIFQYS